jgi:hypothetical protein
VAERVVEDIEPFGVDGRDVFPQFARADFPGCVPVDGRAMWPADATRIGDAHAAFIGRFSLDQDGEVELQALAADVYRAWLNDEWLMDGPRRFAVAAPACDSIRRTLGVGEHTIAAHVHGFGARTRMLAELEPFFWCRVLTRCGEEIEVEWRAAELQGYSQTQIRTSPLFGWIEWCDTRVDGDWRADPRISRDWQPTGRGAPGVGAIAATRSPVPIDRVPLEAITSGAYRERRAFMEFEGEELDNPVIQLMTTDLDPPAGEPLDGAWVRYDLGRPRCGTVHLTVDGQAGTEVIVASAERLYDGRLIPINSPGRTCFVSRFVLRGGRQELEPLSAQGARFVEVRVTGAPDAEMLAARFHERDGLGPHVARFECGDPELERIWATGLETLRAAAEDAVVDSMRERAQWTGDTLTVGLELGAIGWSDLSLFRQALFQAAECANREGIVAGCGPGDVIYLSTYAAHWLGAGVRYVELTGETDVLRELLPAARANLGALRRRMTPDGTFEGAPWPFVDWGHAPPASGPDAAVAAIVLAGARALSRWEGLIGAAPSDADAFAAELTDLLERRLGTVSDWSAFGYHATVWALRCDLVPPAGRPAALASVREHLLRCFPNDPEAPRLRNPGVRDERLITPFFGHFALDVLLDAGDVDFVMEQWRSCWGWMLAQGATTWWEVFDEGWSHCHFWSGCPSWQMSRHLLGLWPRFDRGPGEVDLRLTPGSLPRASGTVALPGGEASVEWERAEQGIGWTARSTVDLVIRHAGESHRLPAGGRLELDL